MNSVPTSKFITNFQFITEEKDPNTISFFYNYAHGDLNNALNAYHDKSINKNLQEKLNTATKLAPTEVIAPPSTTIDPSPNIIPPIIGAVLPNSEHKKYILPPLKNIKPKKQILPTGKLITPKKCTDVSGNEFRYVGSDKTEKKKKTLL